MKDNCRIMREAFSLRFHCKQQSDSTNEQMKNTQVLYRLDVTEQNMNAERSALSYKHNTIKCIKI